METNRRIDEELLEESLEDLYENAPCGYVSTLPDGTFVKVNRTFLTWIGYRREELLGSKRFQDLLTVAGKIFHETHYRPLLYMQGAVNEIAFDLICQNGQRLHVLINTVQKYDDSGTPRLHRTTIFNASDRRKYERELLIARKQAEQAAEAKAQFLSTISHEIRTPLSAITLASQALEKTNPDPKQQRYIRILQSSAQSLLALVNDILDYSRIEAGKVTLDEKPFSIRELINDILDRLAAKAEQKQLMVHVEIDERIPVYLIGDVLKIGQVLTNLIGNAIKFTEAGSVQISVVAAEITATIVSINFSIKDTGIGIAPEHLAHIFEEFTQASSEITGRYGGTGLGLAISQKLLQLYGSQIRVDSTPGVGSTFSFNLRLKRRPEDT